MIKLSRDLYNGTYKLGTLKSYYKDGNGWHFITDKGDCFYWFDEIEEIVKMPTGDIVINPNGVYLPF